jgi:radical SAM protein with 4Fe4S-binding SPASM domain
MVEQKQTPPAAIPFYFAISKTCNLDCTYCYVPKYNKEKQSEADTIAIQACDDMVEKFDNEGARMPVAILHGAEPTTLSPETINYLITNLHKRSENKCRMQTNGTRLTARYMERMGDLSDKLRIGFSIDGPKCVFEPFRGPFYDLVMENMDRAIALGYEVSVLSVVTSLTLEHLDEYAAWLEEMKRKKGVILSIKMGHGKSYQLDWNKQIEFGNWLYETDNARHCQMFKQEFCQQQGNQCEFYEFDMEGGCYSCNKTFCDEGDFADWYGEDFKQIRAKRRALFRGADFDPNCKECPYWEMCRASCPVERINGRALECGIKKTVFGKMRENNEDAINMFMGGSTMQAPRTIKCGGK